MALERDRVRFKPPADDAPFRQWIRDRVQEEAEWLQKMELWPGLETPGAYSPAEEKLPRLALPQDLTGMRILDIGCAEGFFAFEAERRGADEVIAIDPRPSAVRRFNVCKDALQADATAYLCSIYDLSPRTFGTFDLVLLLGFLERVPSLVFALDKVRQVCSGSMILESAVAQQTIGEGGDPPFMILRPQASVSEVASLASDATGEVACSWLPNRRCLEEMLALTGFVDCEVLSGSEDRSVITARSSEVRRGEAPDQMTAPWS